MGNETTKEVRPVVERKPYEKLTNKELLIVKEYEWARELSLEKQINHYYQLTKK